MGRDLFNGMNPNEQVRPPRDLFENEMPEQDESFLQKLPRNVAIGLVHAGRDLHNLPHDIASGVDTVGSSIGRFFGAPELQNQNSNLASYLPYDKQNYAQALGQQGAGTGMDKAIQLGAEIVPSFWSGANTLRQMKILPYLTQKGAAGTLSKASKIAKTRNIAPINVSPELIEDAAKFFPNNSAYNNMLEGARYGDYNSLLHLQSDLGKHASEYAKSLFSSAAERIHGRAGMATRNKLLGEIHEGLQSQGHEDISHLLRKGQEEYRRYKKFKPYRNMGMAAGAAYSIPKNALTNLVQKLLLHMNQ